MERAHRSAEATGRRARRTAAKDAIALLKADHRQVEAWFSQFKKARKEDRKRDLAAKICHALRVHTRIEEEIFYPAFLAATDETDLHHEAEVEHAGAKNLIGQIEAMSPGDDYYDAKVKVLAEMIKHHVKEEEKPGGMFAKARKSSMDLDELGERMKARKDQLGNGDNALLRRIGKSVLDA
jgi:hemerythrin superfamily protein